MVPIERINLNPLSNTVANAALARGWFRDVAWPADVLGEYGVDSTTPDSAVDDWVEQQTGVRPGASLPLDDTGILRGVLSACPGRDRHNRPVVRLSLRCNYA